MHASQNLVSDIYIYIYIATNMQHRLNYCCKLNPDVSNLCWIFLCGPRSVEFKIPIHVYSKCNSLLYVNSHAANLHRREFLIVHCEESNNCLHHDIRYFEHDTFVNRHVSTIYLNVPSRSRNLT